MNHGLQPDAHALEATELHIAQLGIISLPYGDTRIVSASLSETGHYRRNEGVEPGLGKLA